VDLLGLYTVRHSFLETFSNLYHFCIHGFQVSSDLQFKSEFSEKNQINELNLLAIENTVIIVPKWFI
jgi:hypothetical protein